MALFSKTKNMSGWMATSLLPEGVVAACVTRGKSGRPTVEQAVFHPCDPSVHVQTLAAVAKEAHANRWNCSHILNPGEYQLLSVEAPNVPAEELRTAIRWRLKDMLDFHVDDATIDVLSIPADKNAGGRGRSMHAVAARNSLIEARQSLFQQAKITLKAIDIVETAQRNISALLEPEGRALAMLTFDNTGGLLTVTHGGELYLSRRVDITLAQLSEAEQFEQRLERITLELQRSLDHFDRQFNQVALARLMLPPMEGNASRLKDYLSSNLYVPVEEFELRNVLDMSRVPALNSTQTCLHFLTVLGGALRFEETAL
jgi:MSHA biogenesis protein MshI